MDSAEEIFWVCTKGKTCKKRESKELCRALKKQIAKGDLETTFKVEKADCLGLCEFGPIVRLAYANLTYCGVKPKDCRDIIRRQFAGKKPLKRLLLKKKKGH